MQYQIDGLVSALPCRGTSQAVPIPTLCASLNNAIYRPLRLGAASKINPLGEGPAIGVYSLYPGLESISSVRSGKPRMYWLTRHVLLHQALALEQHAPQYVA